MLIRFSLLLNKCLFGRFTISSGREFQNIGVIIIFLG